MSLVDKSIVLTDSVIDELLDDWFDRDGETFTHKRKVGRIGWEKTLEAGDSYSAYLLEAPTQEDLIKRAYSLAKDTIVSMNTPYKVTIKITNSFGGTSGTDGKVVYLNTSMFDDKELSVGEKLDTFLGVTIHEGCHLLYTDMSLLKHVDSIIIKNIWNVIEDERIEEMLGDSKPGFANFLEKSKYYYFDQFYLDYIVPKEKEGKLTPFDRIMSLFLQIIRYPKYLKESEVIEFGHYLIAIKKVIFPYPDTTMAAYEAAEKIYDIIKELYIEDEREKAASKSSEEESDDTGTGEVPSEGEILSGAAERMKKDGKDFTSAMESKAVTKTPDKSLDIGDMAKAVSADGGLLGEICEGCTEVGGGKDTFFSRMTDAKEEYMASYDRVKRYVPAIARIMKGHCREYKYIHRSMRSGLLDTNKLAEAVQGVPTCYIREGEVKTDKISVCVVIDESGSMGGSRIRAARDTAILINEALKQVHNVELFIYGHSGDMRKSRSTEMNIYREKGYAPRFSLGKVAARCENRDGVAIEEIAERVRKQTKNPVLMFVLSDGSPDAGGYYGSAAITHVRNVVSKLEKKNFQIIQVCINHSYDPSEMFKHFVIMEDMSTLAIELSKTIKKAALSAAKVSII